MNASLLAAARVTARPRMMTRSCGVCVSRAASSAGAAAAPPRGRPGAPDAVTETGRGLDLVDALSGEWGYFWERDRKVVYAVLLLPQAR